MKVLFEVLRLHANRADIVPKSQDRPGDELLNADHSDVS